MIIRAAQTTDAEAAAELSTQLGYPCSETEVKKRIIDLSAQKDNTLFICEVDGVVVEWIQVAVERFIGSAPFAEVCGLVIAEQQRGRGVGRMLLEFAEGWAADRGLDTIYVSSNIIREKAHHFYLQNGYQIKKSQYVFFKEL